MYLCVYVDNSPSVDANGNGNIIKVWKSFKCICGRDIDGEEACPVKFLYKYNCIQICYEAFQSEGVHITSGSNKKRKLSELPKNVQNAFVAMVATGSQPANIVRAMIHKPLHLQKELFPEAIYQVIIVL